MKFLIVKLKILVGPNLLRTVQEYIVAADAGINSLRNDSNIAGSLIN